MNKHLPLPWAVNGIIGILSLFVVFHFLVLLKVIPSAIVWGGRLQSDRAILLMEWISIALSLFFIAITCLYAGYLRAGVSERFLRSMLWLMCAFFTLNTAGNLAARTWIETLLFTPLTALLSLCCFRIAAYGFKEQRA